MLITLTTDFGSRDSYVAQVKAALVTRGPRELRMLDLSHEIPPQDVRAGAFFLRYAVPRFPPGTVHLAVIDPGVGTPRRPLAVRAGGQYLVGPDNGLFSWLTPAVEEAVVLDPQRFGLGDIRPTFHGRDLFAPAAAVLAGGRALSGLGVPTRSDQLAGEPWPAPTLVSEAGRAPQRIEGQVVHVDHFGNVITNIDRATLSQLVLPALAEGACVHVAGHVLSGVQRTYGDAAPGAAIALFGSEDLLEVAVRNGSATRELGVSVGTPVVVS